MSRGAIVACSCSSRLPQDVVLESSHDVFEKRRRSQSIMAVKHPSASMISKKSNEKGGEEHVGALQENYAPSFSL